MKLLFEEAAQNCYYPLATRVRKLKRWISQAESARSSGDLDPFLNQYDKAEELITFYAFAPLMLSLNRVGLTNRILSLVGVSAYEENVVNVALEKQFSPPTGYLSWIRNEVKNHPVRYIREQSIEHSKRNKNLESRTNVDAFIETDKLLILFEVKYTSDIANSTTFNPYRNQLARLVDVGLEEAKHSGKEVLVVLSSPSFFYESKSRLYYYKVQEYTSPLLIQKDIGWRSLSEIKDNVLAVRWVALEQLVSVLYKDFVHDDKKEALDFFEERNLAIDNYLITSSLTSKYLSGYFFVKKKERMRLFFILCLQLFLLLERSSLLTLSLLHMHL